jgi:CHAT domain-containing protein/Flp pilus assembly protein TadD
MPLENELLNQGVERLQEGDYEAALNLLDRAIAQNSQQADAWYQKGLLLQKLGRYVEAVAANERFMALASTAKKVDKALKPLNHAPLFKISPQPDLAEQWLEQGNQQHLSGDFEGAIASYDKSLEFLPTLHRAWHSRGSALNLLNRYKEAIISLDKSLKFNPDCYGAWAERGTVLFHLNCYEEAISSYDKALQFNPDEHEIWDSRGFVVLSSPTYSQFPALTVGAILSQQHPQLNQRGYSGQVVTLEFGLMQVAPQSKGWGYLQRALGEAHFNQGKREQQQSHNTSTYWQKARHCLEQALSVLSAEAFPLLRLKTLELMIRLLLHQGNAATAQTHRKAGVELLQILLNQAPTPFQKQQLEAEFSGFSQIAVDVWLQANEPIIALETAERYKNRCLTWILEAWRETVISPSYAMMQTLCTPDTAVVYWHLSPDSLTTFIFTDKNDRPQVLEGNNASQFQQFTTLLQEWHREYQDYASQKFTGTDGENHPWQKNLVLRLDKLRQKILQIEAITQKLPDSVKTLILVPHRDLHLLPLHALFPDRLSCVYLPSLQIGLNLSQKARENSTYAPLLSVEDPATEQPPMHFAKLESAIIQLIVKNATCISRNDAATDIVIHNLKKSFSTLHFTGHGAYNSRTPSDSGIALTDGLLTAKEISQLDLSSYKLIVLASCETALTGNEGIKTEYVGLASAFLKAGATNVLSTLWPVDEISSAWLMIRFYQFLLTGDTPSMALRQAQRWLKTVTWQQLAAWIAQLSQLPNLGRGYIDILTPRAKNTLKEGTIMGLDKPTKYSHPYYWAAFTMTGQG